MPKAAVEIRATDCFGKVYTQNVFTTAAETDYPMVGNLSCGRRIAGQGHSANFILG